LNFYKKSQKILKKDLVGGRLEAAVPLLQERLGKVMAVRPTIRCEYKKLALNPHTGSDNSYYLLVGGAAPINAYHNYITKIFP